MAPQRLILPSPYGDDLPPECWTAYATAADLGLLLGVTRRTILRWRGTGYLPRPVFGEGCVTVWDVSRVLRWLDADRPLCNPRRADFIARRTSPERLLEFLVPVRDPLEDDARELAELSDWLEARLNIILPAAPSPDDLSLDQTIGMAGLIRRLTISQRRPLAELLQ